MAKKKAAARRAATKKKTTKHTDTISQMTREEVESYLTSTPPSTLIEAFEESYTADLVNVLLDMKKSVVKELFEKLLPVRKRPVLPALTLYHYRDYLTNPLPLTIASTNGEQIPNYYAILGAPRDVDDDDLKEAYKLLVKAFDEEEFSPDTRDAGRSRLEEIHDAFSNLKTTKKRSEADERLPNINYLYPRREQFWLDAVRRLTD